MNEGPPDLDHRDLFAGLRNPLAVISTSGAFRVAALTAGFREALHLQGRCVGEPLLPLLPPQWRGPVEAAVQACMGARRSKRVRSLSHGAATRRFQLNVYRAVADDRAGHVVLSLEDTDEEAWFTDPRVASLFPPFDKNRGAMIYESDVRSQRVRYRDNGLIEQFGFSAAGLSFDEHRARLHPDDVPQLERFWAARAHLTDSDINTLTVRMRAVSGDWRLVTIRARVLRRDSRGAPRRMLGVAVDITDHNGMSEALVDAQAALARAEEEERRNIGRELHDSTGQHLFAISAAVGNLERATTPTPASEAAIRDINTLLDTAGREIRMVSFLLHPPELAGVGLAAALEQFCLGFARRTGLSVQFRAKGKTARAGEHVETAFYRVAQEALMNAFRHADATSIRVTLRGVDGTLVLEVADDGRHPPHGPRVAGVGMQAMRSRMLQIGGTLEALSRSRGFAIIARAPVVLDTGSSTRRNTSDEAQ